MANISSLGIGSGLDANAIVSQLVAIERQPINLLQTAASTLQTKISSFGKIQSYLDGLNAAADKLNSASTWSSSLATSSSAAVVASSSSGSAAGSYSVTVAHLAASQMAATSALPTATTTVGAGTLNIDIGAWADDLSGFTASGSTISIAIEADDTLEEIRNKINSTDGLAVSASIVKDASGARLVLKSDASGESHGFRVQVSDDDAGNTDNSGLSRLAYDPAGGAAVMTRTQPARNAEGTINGLSVESESNTLTDVIDGVSLSFASITTGPVSVTVADDTESMRTAVKDFATAYNTLVGYLREQTKYNEGSKTGSTLQGDRTAIGLQQQLRTIMGANSSASGAFARASEIGLDVQKDGTIKINDGKLTTALSKREELRAFFMADGATSASDGLAERLTGFADGWLDVEGALTHRQAGLKKLLDINGDRQEAMELRVAATEKRLRAQYTALDASMAQLSNLQNYVSQQITNWNKS